MGGLGARDAVTSRALAAAMASTHGPLPHGLTAVSNAEVAELSRQHLLSQLHLQHGLSDEELLGQLRKVRWFRDLSMSQLDTLYKRARHVFFTRYSVLLREGNVGTTCLVLMQGRVRFTTARDILRTNVMLGAGECVAEGALLTPVLREATVVAQEDAYLLAFTAADVADLPIERPAMRPELVRQLEDVSEGDAPSSIASPAAAAAPGAAPGAAAPAPLAAMGAVQTAPSAAAAAPTPTAPAPSADNPGEISADVRSALQQSDMLQQRVSRAKRQSICARTESLFSGRP